MRRLVVFALLVLPLAACSQGGTSNLFEQAPSSPGSPLAKAHLDTSALDSLRVHLAASLAAHISGGHVATTWGAGSAPDVAGPYRPDQPGTDAAALLAAALQPAGANPLEPARVDVAQAAETGLRTLDGPQGGAYLLLAAADGYRSQPDNACTGSDPAAAVACLRTQVSDGLLKAWYATDTRQFFQVGATSTVYRPVEAFAVGCALLVAGYGEHSSAKITAGMDIVQGEMKASLDPHYGLVYGLATRTAAGGFEPTDTVARLADQAGIAEMLLEAFDLSREAALREDAQKVLTPLLEGDVGLHTDGGLVTSIDTRGTAPAAGSPVDIEATLLALQAGAHYDRDAAPRFAGLEESMARYLAALATSPLSADGLPGQFTPQGPSAYSGLVTAVGVLVLADVTGARPVPLPSLSAVPMPSPLPPVSPSP